MLLTILCLGATATNLPDSENAPAVPSLLPFYSLQMPVSAQALTSIRPGLEALVATPQDDKGWEFEVTPYLWVAGVEADVEVGPLQADVDVGFGDLVEMLDGGGSALGTGKYGSFVYWAQLDYNDFGDDSDRFNFDLEQLIATAAAGWEFDGPFEGSRLGVLGGVRWTRLESELEIGPVKVDGTRNLVDFIVMLRPDIQLAERWRFNPAMSIGLGDSELTYEMWPQIQFQFSERIAARLGYRRLYYRTDDDRVEFDGSLSGLVFGVGITL